MFMPKHAKILRCCIHINSTCKYPVVNYWKLRHCVCVLISAMGHLCAEDIPANEHYSLFKASYKNLLHT